MQQEWLVVERGTMSYQELEIPANDVRRSAASGHPSPPVGWAVALSVVTSIGLAALTFVLLLEHALGYGFAAALFPDTAPVPPDGSRYGLALALGATTNLVLAAGTAGLAHRTPARAWPRALQALAAAVIAGVVAACVLLLTLGIDPVGFVLSL